MKKLSKVFALAVMLILGGQAMAQTHGTMYLSAAFPMSDFASVNQLSSTALWGGENDNYGGAGIGFNAGLKWDFGIGVRGVSVVLSVDGIYNGPNAEMKECYKDLKETYDLLSSNITMTTPKYVNVPAMLGLRYTFYLNPQFGIYAEGGVGGNARFITNYTAKYTDLLGVKHNEVYEYNTAFSFAYQAGLGIEVSRNLVIGCSLYNLGAAPVKGSYSVDNVDNVEFEHGTLEPVMVLGRIGFRF